MVYDPEYSTAEWFARHDTNGDGSLDGRDDGVTVAPVTVDAVTRSSMSFGHAASDTTVTLFGITDLRLSDLA